MAHERTYGLVMVGGDGPALTSRTLPLVAALIALDCHPIARCPLVERLEDMAPAGAEEADLRHSHRWLFPTASTCKRYQTDKLRKWWIEAPWLAENFGHPLARIRAAFHVAGVLNIDHETSAEWRDADLEALGRFCDLARTAGPLPHEWLTREHRAAYPADPLATVGAAFAVLELLREEVRKVVPRMVLKNGQRRAFVPIDATPEQMQAALDRLSK